MENSRYPSGVFLIEEGYATKNGTEPKRKRRTCCQVRLFTKNIKEKFCVSIVILCIFCKIRILIEGYSDEFFRSITDYL